MDSKDRNQDGVDFDDGDIILALPGKRFRVHKTVLAAKSGVFADMFGTVATSDESQSEELPVVDMHDDVEMFALFLHVLYDHDLQPLFSELDPQTAPLIFGVMDLADKYDVPHEDIRRRLVPFLERDWPETLADWDKVEVRVRQLRADLEAKDEGHTLDDRLPEPCAVIRFARVHKARQQPTQRVESYVPAAFYHLSRLYPWADPDYPNLNADDFYEHEGLRTARKALLSHRDLECLLHGIYGLRKTAAEIAFKKFAEAVDDYDGLERVGERQDVLTWWRNVGIERLIGEDNLDPLESLRLLAVELVGENGSTPLKETMSQFLFQEREEIWATLINTFSLYFFFYV